MPLPYTPQAAHPYPSSVQEPLPTQRFVTVGWLEGHAPGATQLPLQTTLGAAQTQSVGFSAGEAVKLFVQVNPHGLLLTHAGLLLTG